MKKVIFAAFAAAIACGAMIAPTQAGTTVMHVIKSQSWFVVGDGFLHNGDGRGCEIRMSWTHDYAGKPYLKKVRVCA